MRFRSPDKKFNAPVESHLGMVIYEGAATAMVGLAAHGLNAALKDTAIKKDPKMWTFTMSALSGMGGYCLSKWNAGFANLQSGCQYFAADLYRTGCQVGVGALTAMAMPYDENFSLTQTAAIVATAKVGGDVLERVGTSIFDGSAKKFLTNCVATMFCRKGNDEKEMYMYNLNRDPDDLRLDLMEGLDDDKVKRQQRLKDQQTAKAFQAKHRLDPQRAADIVAVNRDEDLKARVFSSRR